MQLQGPQKATHEFEEHRSELQLRVDAVSLAGVFAEAARAVAQLMHGAPDETLGPVSQDVVLEAPDREALLVDWLNELVFRSEVAKAVFTDFEFEQLTDERLVAS